jgi:ABC-2 type transport system ATP-binding protein
VREASRGTYLVHGTIDPQVLSTVTSWCAQQGVLAEELTVARRSLEDVFLELTGRELRS